MQIGSLFEDGVKRGNFIYYINPYLLKFINKVYSPEK